MRKFVSRFACDSTRISSRGIHTDDAFETDYDKMQIYKISVPSPEGHLMHERTKFYAQACDKIFEDFYPGKHDPPDHIIHVTCNGYVSPSGAQKLIANRSWNTKITHAYHMGCYASLPSIRLASALVQNEGNSVDVVHTELCSLHLNPANHSPEQIVVQSLFADGFIKYRVSEDNSHAAFEILKIKELIIPESASMMTWMTSNFGMQMSLSKDVPVAIAKHLESFLQDFEFDRSTAIFAIHPGGPRIIDSIQDLLQLDDSKVSHAKSILFRYGNMSSATLPHIWQDLAEDSSISAGTEVMSLAFGPGLTIFGGLLRKL